MSRTSKKGSSSKSSPRGKSRTTSTKTRKRSTRKGKRGFPFRITLVLDVLLLGLIGFLSFRLVEMNRTLKDRASQIQMLQSQLLSARGREPVSEEHKPPAKPASPPSTTRNYTLRQQAILKEIVNTPDIARLIPQKPSLGGQWRCFSEKQVFFLDRNHVAFTYEDGHTRGAAVVQIQDPQKCSTWKVIWSGSL